MKLKSNFSSSLNFQSLSLWPDTVPAVALDGELLCGFHLNDAHPVFEHKHSSSDKSLNLMKSLYPNLSLPELARLTQLPEFQKYFNLDNFLKIYGYHPNPDLLEILKLLNQLAFNFQNFVSLKKVGPQELAPLLSLNPEQQNWVIGEVLQNPESKQDTVKRIELLSDLIQMDNSLISLQSLNLNQLVQKRYPVTTSRDQSLESRNFSWLSQIRSQFKRRGDKAGFEVHFFAGTPAELSKLATNLTRVAQEWNSQS
jgi:hypothetical protein